MSLQATTWQTVGPYFRVGLEHLDCAEIAPPGTEGEHYSVEGQLMDGDGKPVPDAVIEIWQANAQGEYAGQIASAQLEPRSFVGFGRIPTNADGQFSFTTIRPGRVPGPKGIWQAPHLAVRVMMRGLLKDLVTRMYFPGDDTEADPVLQLVPKHRRATLIAKPLSVRGASLQWDVRLQGDRETVFFDC